MKDVRGRNALLTGGSYGVGTHIARALARAGSNVAVAARSVDRLESLAAELRAHGIRAVALPVDLRERPSRAGLIDRAEAALGGPIDILVNNAGSLQLSRFDGLTPQAIADIVELDLVAALTLTRAVLPGMLERRRGSVVQVASVAGKIPLPYQAVYVAAKSGLVGFTHALATELHGTGVHASVVCPGLVAGDGMWARLQAPVPRLSGVSPPTLVATAVLRAIRTGRVEVIVNPIPVRPIAAVTWIAPGLLGWMLRRLGVSRLMAKLAAEHARRP